MEYQTNFEFCVEYLDEFYKSFSHMRLRHHMDERHNFMCFGRSDNSCIYVDANLERQIIYCENIKYTLVDPFLAFSGLDSCSINFSNTLTKRFSSIRGYFEVEVFDNYFVKDLYFSCEPFASCFTIRWHVLRRITKILLRESKKIKRDFKAKINLELEGMYEIVDKDYDPGPNLNGSSSDSD